jgi:hypothetical protein
MESPSTAAQILIAAIPNVGIIAGSTVIISYLYWHHKQRMLMIEKGILQKKSFDYVAFSLFGGCLVSGVGLGLTFFFYVKEGFAYSLLSGLMPLSVGVSLLTFFYLYQNKR